MMNPESGGLLSRLSGALGALRRAILGGRRGTVPRPGEPEFEPVHGWTARQRDDYLGRNPAYVRVYERLLRLCDIPPSRPPPVAEALPRERLRPPLVVRREGRPGQEQAAGGQRAQSHDPE